MQVQWIGELWNMCWSKLKMTDPHCNRFKYLGSTIKQNSRLKLEDRMQGGQHGGKIVEYSF